MRPSLSSVRSIEVGGAHKIHSFFAKGLKCVSSRVNYSVPDEEPLRGSGQRLLTTDVSTFLALLSTTMDTDIDVVGNITLTSETNVKISSSTEG